MARIPSPRVVRAVDVGIYENCPYLAQEYVDGLDLAELDRRRRTALHRGFPLWFVCLSVSQIANALHSAHQTGVLHRDVKPSNIFGSPQTGIRLGDFGIAVGRGRSHDDISGTPRFIAPEALRGQTPTRRCDVYSLGATAYDLYYGRPPFIEIKDILSETPAQFPPACSPEEAYFQYVLARMLEYYPEKRCPSVTGPLRQLGTLGKDLRPSLSVVRVGQGIFQLGPMRIECILGDIADVESDGIVNSANDEMKMQSGVSLALKKKGGDMIEQQAMGGGRRALGECIATSSGALSCRYVLHAVSAWKEASCIVRACQRALLLAEELGLRTLAMPALGTGVAQVAPEACAYAVGAALQEHVLLGGSHLRQVTLVLYDKETLEIFIEQLSGLFLGDTESDEGDAAVPFGVGMEDTVRVDETVLLRNA